MIFRSPYPDICIPEQALTEFVLQRAVELAQKPAFIEGLSDRIITYGQLADSIGRVAAGLAARGFSQGDVFAIYSPNLPEYVIAFHAVATNGGIITTVNPSYTAQELAYQLNDASAKYLITIPELLGQALEAVSHSKVEEIFVFGSAAGATPFSALLEGEEEVPKVQINPKEDLVALLYSSGTTGMPKGVMHTHSTFIANFLSTYTPDERDKIKLGSVGQCLSHVECQIVAVDTQQPLGFHQAGELWIRGPQIMKGYLNNLEATANTIDRDGWYHTGDIVYVDEDGYFYIVDRIKELIKCNAYSIAPAELEAVLLSHPAVADACVVKSPHPSSGEVPKAFIVLKATATPEEIMQFVAERVAPHKMLRRLEFVDKIPKYASGKILRRILAQQELEKFTEASSDEQPLQLQREFLQQLDETSLPQRQELFIAYLREQFVKVLSINTSQHLDIEKPLHELRLDSLMSIDLKNRLDTELGVDIPIEIFLGNSNISQLVNLLLQQLVAKNTTFSKKVSSELATDLNSEVVLDSTIKPEYLSESCVTEAAAIFLTGSTGFLGAFLLQELLLQTQADVYCLVRANDAESGKIRIQNNLESYGIWQEDVELYTAVRKVVAQPPTSTRPYIWDDHDQSFDEHIARISSDIVAAGLIVQAVENMLSG